MASEKIMERSTPVSSAGEDTGKRLRRSREAMEFGFQTLFLLCGFVSVACVLFICLYLIVSGLPAILEIGVTDFLFGTEWAGRQDKFGILPFILTSVAGTAGAVLVGVPVGVLTALFLAKVAPDAVARVIRTAVELLAGIPSIVYGLVGMIVLVPAIQRAFQLSSGACLLAAIVVLAIMILPSIINVAETSLRAVPKEYEKASLALGATHIETIFRVTLPAARSGRRFFMHPCGLSIQLLGLLVQCPGLVPNPGQHGGAAVYHGEIYAHAALWHGAPP